MHTCEFGNVCVQVSVSMYAHTRPTLCAYMAEIFGHESVTAAVSLGRLQKRQSTEAAARASRGVHAYMSAHALLPLTGAFMLSPPIAP